MKKNFKRLVSAMLSFVLFFGGIPSFVNEAHADRNREILVSPLIRNHKASDAMFLGAGVDGAYIEEITDVKWYKESDLSELSQSSTFESGEDYIVSMVWHERCWPMENDLDFELYNFYQDEDNLASAEYYHKAEGFYTNDEILAHAKSEKDSFFDDLSSTNSKDKRIFFFIDDVYDIMVSSQNLELKLYRAPFPESTDEDLLVPIEWTQIGTNGFDLGNLRIGTNQEDANNNGQCVTINGSPLDNIVNTGEEWNFTINYKQSGVNIPNEVKRNVSVNGNPIFYSERAEEVNGFDILQYYKWTYYGEDDVRNKNFSFPVNAVACDEIESASVGESYIDDNVVHVQLKDNFEDMGNMNNMNVFGELYEGTFDVDYLNKNTMDVGMHKYATSWVDVNMPYSYDSATSTIDFYFNFETSYVLEDRDYTLVIRTKEQNDDFSKPYCVHFHPVAKASYDILVRDMKKGTNMNEWLSDALSWRFCEIVHTSVHWLSFEILGLDEIDQIDAQSTFDETTKWNITFSYYTATLPQSVKLVKGNSDYNEVTLTRNENMDLFDHDTSLQDYMDSEEYDEMRTAFAGYENQYNYRKIEGAETIFPIYQVVCKVTLDFSEQSSTHTTKKYTVKNVNTSAEKIAGSGKKGSTRTITPKEGRKVSSVTVTDSKGNRIPVTMNADGTYSFIQPASAVNVEVNYKNREIVLNIGSTDAYVDDELNNLDVCPLVRNDRTMLPIRFVAENLGAKVTWDETSPEYVLIEKEGIKIEITLGSDKAKVNGKEFTLDSVAFAENDRTYLPVRFVSENLNAIVEWNEAKPMEVKIYER